jgi:exosortase
MFFQDLIIVFKDALQSEAINYILAIPFLLAFLIYRKRKMIRASISLKSPILFERFQLNEILGGLLFLISFLLYWYGSRTFTPLEYHMFVLPIFTSAILLILFNVQTLRQLLFPIIFLFLLIPPPVEMLYSIGAFLSILSSELTYHLLTIFGFPVSLGSMYGNPVIYLTQQNGKTIPFMVDIACSGIYSQIGFLIFAFFVAYIIRDKYWKKILVFALGLPLIFILNVLRMFTIGVIGYYYGEDLALQVFHVLGGWMLIFLGTLILLVTSELILKIQVVSESSNECEGCTKIQESMLTTCYLCGRIYNPRWNGTDKRNIAKVITLIIAFFLILNIQTSVFALTEGPAEIIQQTVGGEQVTTEILPSIPDYNLKFIYRDEAFEEEAKQDASLIYAYLPENDSEKTVWIAIEIAQTRTPLHRWEVCLVQWRVRVGYQPLVEEIELEDVQLLQNPPIIGRYFIFEYRKTNVTQAVLYWYEDSVFQTNSTSTIKHVKISVIMYPDDLDELPNIKEQLLETATEIVNYWKPKESWSSVALLISQSGDKLMILASVLLCGVVLLYIVNRRKEMKENNIAYEKLSDINQQMVQVTHTTEGNTLPTLNNISKIYNRITKTPINQGEVMQKLSELEEIGVLRREIVNKQDEPIQTWRTNCTL